MWKNPHEGDRKKKENTVAIQVILVSSYDQYTIIMASSDW